MSAAAQREESFDLLRRLLPLAEARLECREKRHDNGPWTPAQYGYARGIIGRARRLLTIRKAAGEA